MIYADANFLDAAVRHIAGRTGILKRVLRQQQMAVSPLALYELRKALASLPSVEKIGVLERLDALLGCGVAILPAEWDGAIDHALRVADEFGGRLAVDSADTLHVGWAKMAGCSHFGSFDRTSGPRALAKACALEVIPPMEQKDWQQMRRLKGPAA